MTCSSAPTSTTCRWILRATRFFLEKHTQPVDNVAGVIFHTRIADANPGEPDAVPTLSNIEIWDTAIGVVIPGLDDQGMKIDKIRIRQTLRQGLLVGKPVGHRCAAVRVTPPARQITSSP